jgi:hypothetical protein
MVGSLIVKEFIICKQTVHTVLQLYNFIALLRLQAFWVPSPAGLCLLPSPMSLQLCVFVPGRISAHIASPHERGLHCEETTLQKWQRRLFI